MRFAYYEGLARRQKAIYRKSDKVGAVRLPSVQTVVPLAEALERALRTEQRIAVQRAANAVVRAVLDQLEVAPVSVRVLSKRPSEADSELHGFYEHEEGKRAIIRVWMRTAARRRTVAYRTFLRTLLHEVVHHLDFQWLQLAESFHTEGFFRRESSLMRQIAPKPMSAAPSDPPAPSPRQQLALWAE